MPDSKKSIHVNTKSGIKTNQLAKFKKKRRKIVKCYWTRTHIFCAERTASYPLGYRGIAIFSCIEVFVLQSKALILQRFTKIRRKVIEYSYVSGQCRQTILCYILITLNVID